MSATLVLTEALPEPGMRTPHTAGYVRTAFDRMAVATAENALAGLDGRLDRDAVVNAEVLGNR